MRRLALALACLTVLTGPAAAGQDDARRAFRPGQAIPLSYILSGLRERYPGRVLDADIVERGGGDWTYGIRLLDPRGRVVELDVDARSGRVLRERGARGGGGGNNGAVAPGFAPQGGYWERFRNRGDDRDESRGRDRRGDRGRRSEENTVKYRH